MSASEPASSGVEASSSSSSVPPTWIRDAFESERISALRQSIRGVETQLVDLVFQSSNSELLMDWLKLPLDCAAAAGNLAAVKRLLAAGVKTETPPERWRRPPLLHLAAEGGDEVVVEELLKAGAYIHETDSVRQSQTALHCAAAAGSDAAVRALASAGASIDVLDAGGRTPLHLACIGGHRGVVVFLLLTGACGGARGEGIKFPPLHLAAANNHPGVIEDLLSFGNVCVGSSDVIGQSALHVAAEYGGVGACVALLRGGASAGRISLAGSNCLDAAAWGGHTRQQLEVLIAGEAEDVRKRMCNKALPYAVRRNNRDTIRDLVALGADVEYRQPDLIPHLHLAAWRGNDDALETLLQAGANVELRFHGCTPLHFACTCSHVRAVQLLLYWGADENAAYNAVLVPSEIVGALVRHAGEELPPEEVARNKLAEDSIRSMLETAPADRTWRRRGWLVLCRARWLARIGARIGASSSSPLGYIPDAATGPKKRRGNMPDSALFVKPNDLSLCKGKAHRQNEGGGRHLPEAPAPAAEELRLGPCSVLSDGGAGQAGGIERLDGRTLFVAAVEQLLLLQEDSIFREVLTFL